MDSQLRAKLSLAKPSHFLALGFGSGLSPRAPGTMGSLAAIPLVYLNAQLPLWVAAFVALVAAISGAWICGQTADDMGVHDHSSIVWDEVAGMLIAMLAVPLTGMNILVGFVLFRLFDILKPWPISYLDKHIHGGWGIMLDDIAAGLATLACMQLALGMGWL